MTSMVKDYKIVVNQIKTPWHPYAQLTINETYWMCHYKQWFVCLSCSVKVDGSIQEVELAKNVPYSVARKHQQLLCGYLQGSFFTYDDLESGPWKAIYQATCTCISFAWYKVDTVVPSMLTKIYLKAACISHVIECLQSGLVLQFTVAFSYDYKCPSHGPFLRIFWVRNPNNSTCNKSRRIFWYLYMLPLCCASQGVS